MNGFAEKIRTAYRNKRSAYPVCEWLEIGILLCFAGGFLDAYTYLTRGGVFANAQTGNLILLSIGLARGDGVSALRYLIPILLFMAGVFVSEFFLSLGKKDHSDFRGHSSVLYTEVAVLLFVSFCDMLPFDMPDMAVNALVSFAAAVQFDNFRKMEGLPFATAFCTGNLRSASEQLFCTTVKKERRSALPALKYLLVISAFVGGVFAGFFTIQAIHGLAALVPAAVLFLVSAAIQCGELVSVSVRKLKGKQIESARELIYETFTQFVAPDFTEEGIENFRKFLYDETLPGRAVFYGVFRGHALKGALAVENNAHVCAFFVKNGEQGKGYGGRLMRGFLERSEPEVTVNASPYGKPVYEKLGFTATEDEQMKDGMRFTPMVYRKRK